MSGHSKWANIKRQKAVVDAKKGATYARMAREIIVAAKFGGPDPAANFRLRQAIDRAKAEGVPNDNIQRAIEKGSGTGSSSDMEELTYEGYGPGGVAVMVRCATDNRNRTAGDIRSYFSKFGGNLGETGCVGWMFKERGEIAVLDDKSTNEDELILVALEAGADDVERSEDGSFLILCPPDKVEVLQSDLEKVGIKAASADLVLAPLSTVEVSDRDSAKLLLKLLDNLENHEDVHKVVANFEIREDWLVEFIS